MRPLERAQDWLFHSGIYILQRDDPNFGAVYSHYDSKGARHELIYAEVTGYVLSLLRYMCTIHNDDELISAARASGEWLTRWAAKHDGIIAVGIRNGIEIREAYAFDNGICCKGLLDLYELTAEDRYLKCAEGIAAWLINDAVNEDGSVKPVFDVSSRRFVENPALWYKVSGSFHAKIAMALLQLCKVRQDTRTRDAAVRICEWAVSQQRRDGSFPANKDSAAVNLHFHCYTIEALIYAYVSLGTPSLIAAAEKAVNWMAGIQAPNGRLPRWYRNGAMRTRGSDAQAQATRVFALMHMLTHRPEFAEAARKASTFLLEMQRAGRDARIDGGFFEGDVQKYRFLTRASANMPSWPAMFAIHALHLMKVLESGDFHLKSQFLF